MLFATSALPMATKEEGGLRSPRRKTNLNNIVEVELERNRAAASFSLRLSNNQLSRQKERSQQSIGMMR